MFESAKINIFTIQIIKMRLLYKIVTFMILFLGFILPIIFII